MILRKPAIFIFMEQVDSQVSVLFLIKMLNTQPHLVACLRKVLLLIDQSLSSELLSPLSVVDIDLGNKLKGEVNIKKKKKKKRKTHTQKKITNALVF